MKIILIIGGAVIALIVIVLLIGAFLPRNHVASREIILRRSQEEIYAVIRDFPSAPAWRPDLQSVEMLSDVDGRVRFREQSKQGRITYEVVEDKSPRTLVTRIVDQDLGYSGTWTYALSPADHGTQVRITEAGEVSNVLFRFLSRFVFGHTATMDAYLRALAGKFGEEAEPK
ncbi:MAG TPA: SRPBCC family protein [Chthoniobacterales bacterium]|nr:SRPBCC family protein [Chthoniobacterales bacterium]